MQWRGDLRLRVAQTNGGLPAILRMSLRFSIVVANTVSTPKTT